MRRSRIERRARLSTGQPVKRVNRARKDREWKRAYGSENRLLTIRLMPCSVPGCGAWPCDNAHVAPAGEKGAGYKGGFEWVVPLCRRHHRILDDVCGSVEVFDVKYATRLRETAKRLAKEIPCDGGTKS